MSEPSPTESELTSLPGETKPAPPAPRALVSRVVRALVSAGLVTLLVVKIPLQGVGDALIAMPVSGLALALLVMVVQLVLGVARWRRMLVRTGETIALHVLITDTLVGAAYALLVPTLGSDVVRAQRCSKRLSRPHHAWSTVLFERLVGMLSLAAVSVPGIAIVPEGRSLVVPTLGLVAVCVIALIVAKAPLRLVSRLLVQRAPHLASISDGIAADLEGPLATTPARLEALTWSFAYQLTGLSILTACVVPQGDTQLILAIYAGLPLIAIGMMIPISLGGVGQREGLFVLILGLLGVPRTTALALSLLWLGSYVVVAIAGVLVILFERGSPGTVAARADIPGDANNVNNSNLTTDVSSNADTSTSGRSRPAALSTSTALARSHRPDETSRPDEAPRADRPKDRRPP